MWDIALAIDPFLGGIAIEPLLGGSWPGEAAELSGGGREEAGDEEAAARRDGKAPPRNSPPKNHKFTRTNTYSTKKFDIIDLNKRLISYLFEYAL